MDKEQLIKDIVFVGRNWNADRQKAEEVLASISAVHNCCQQCGDNNPGNIFWVVEEIQSGIFIKKYLSNVFTVCGLKCLFDRGLNKKAYYSVVVRLANGEVLSTGFQGLDALAINDFSSQLIV